MKFPVYLSWVLLKRDGKRIQIFVIFSKPMKGTTITRWGKRRWQIEGFFKTIKYQFGRAHFREKSLLGVYRLLILSLIYYLLVFTFR
ncbi:MAG: transposase [Moorea sp. SIO2B7]|nr:transposase [Moorena sp. SIO2B7]